MNDAERQAYTDKMIAAVDRMGPDVRKRFDEAMSAQLDQLMKRYQQMGETFTALRVLHRAGVGEREGFCVECGNVMPCQTVKFIEPLL